MDHLQNNTDQLRALYSEASSQAALGNARAARDAVAKAQQLARRTLPEVSETWKVQVLTEQARFLFRDGSFVLAGRVMTQAQSYWRSELGIAMPAFSAEEQAQIQRTPFEGGLSREDVNSMLVAFQV
ncbi:hypothetical protein N7522_000290 [Penicillium canescens]|nr:hypothetical protein N7522_000290 [Penicillium canescens]